MASESSPQQLLHLLNDIFSMWDALCEEFKIEKIKTIGGLKFRWKFSKNKLAIDCYMAASGVPNRIIDHAARMLEFSIALTRSMEKYNEEKGTTLQVKKELFLISLLVLI